LAAGDDAASAEAGWRRRRPRTAAVRFHCAAICTSIFQLRLTSLRAG